MNNSTPKTLTENINNFGEYAYLTIDKQFRKILQYEIEVLKDKDPEQLHQMRVSMRRLRSIITGFAPALILPRGGREDKIGQIGKTLGALRDLDVLQETLETSYYPQLPKSEKKYLKQALIFLQHQRKFALKNVKKLLKSEIYKKFKKTYFSWLENPSFQEIAHLSIYPILPDLLFPQLSNFLLHPGWLLGVKINQGNIKFPEEMDVKTVENILSNEGKILHDLRKEAKRSRYNMELFNGFYGKEYQQYVGKVKYLQEVLGDIQDCYVLSEFLSGIFDFDLLDKMPVLSNIFSETRYLKWQQWTTLQQYFFEIPTGILLTERQKIRNIIQSATVESSTDEKETPISLESSPKIEIEIPQDDQIKTEE
jgi:CHAD domain-containing protein